MSREIKFRAWYKLKKKYVDVIAIDFEKCRVYTTRTIRGTCNGYLMFNDCVLEQFTGLHDKNGVEIYDGDIVKSNKSKYTRFNESGIYEVYFNEFLCHYALVDSSVEWNNKNGAYDNYSLTGAKTKDFEVIGNIHSKEN